MDDFRGIIWVGGGGANPISTFTIKFRSCDELYFVISSGHVTTSEK